MRYLLLITAVVATPAWAECPPTPDISGAIDGLISQAHEAANDAQGRDVSNQMWRLWLQARDAAAQEVLDAGMRARESYDFLGAVKEFTRLVDYCPSYAEGYNQRAFVQFLREDYAAALIDLDLALALSPTHVGAQSGRALTLMHLGRLAEARVQLRAALENNPWLSERFLLDPGGPLALEAKDI